MRNRLDNPRGFTIVELIIVIGVIALLLALLAPALSGVRNRGQLTQQTSNLRQVGAAWNVYSNSSGDQILPGYIDYQGPDNGAQGLWASTFRFPNGEPIPPEVAAPWPWRLWPYLDDASFLLDYKLDGNINKIALLNDAQLRADLALRPRFGYNAYYMGGWFEYVDFPEGGVAPLPKFYNATNDDGNAVNVVTRSLGTVRRSTDLVVFTGATHYTSGSHANILENAEGSHTVTPPYLGDQQRWAQLGGDPSAVETFVNTEDDPVGGAPAARIARQIPTLFADMHTATQTFGDLNDMRRWIDTADTADFQHQ